MSTLQKPIDLQPGAVLPGGIHFVSQHLIEDPQADFSIELPGTVHCCKDAVVQSILPRARIVLPETKPQRAAILSATVTDTHLLRLEGEALTERIDSVSPLSFALRFSAPKSFDAVLDAAENASGGCDCGGHVEAAMRGAISIGLAPGAGGNLEWSAPIGAMLFAKTDDSLIYGAPAETAQMVAIKENCSETWYFWDYKTYCTGHACMSPQVCKCGDGPNNVPRISCDGWVRCNCTL